MNPLAEHEIASPSVHDGVHHGVLAQLYPMGRIHTRWIRYQLGQAHIHQRSGPGTSNPGFDVQEHSPYLPALAWRHSDSQEHDQLRLARHPLPHLCQPGAGVQQHRQQCLSSGVH